MSNLAHRGYRTQWTKRAACWTDGKHSAKRIRAHPPARISGIRCARFSIEDDHIRRTASLCMPDPNKLARRIFLHSRYDLDRQLTVTQGLIGWIWSPIVWSCALTVRSSLTNESLRNACSCGCCHAFVQLGCLIAKQARSTSDREIQRYRMDPLSCTACCHVKPSHWLGPTTTCRNIRHLIAVSTSETVHKVRSASSCVGG